ncbi:MAG: hypothetical protein QM811_08185 [Pirellulales bacterium]
MIKESLLERVIACSVTMAESELLLCAALADSTVAAEHDEPEHWAPTVVLWRSLLAEDIEQARRDWPAFIAAVHRQPLLYVPLSKGGDPRRIAVARSLQQTLRMLLAQLPGLGMLREACQLIQTARAMERDHPLGPGAVTEFDRLFEIGFKAVVDRLIDSSREWELQRESSELADLQLSECLQQVTEALLSEWLSHSRTLRLSVLEKIGGEAEWRDFVAFVEKYGHDLFTQKFFNLGNLRDPASRRRILDQATRRARRGERRRRTVGRLGRRVAARRRSQASAIGHRSDRRKLHRVSRLQRHDDAIRSRRNGVHAARFPPHQSGLRAHPLEPATGDDCARSAGPRRRASAAELWRRTMAERTADAADQHQKRLAQLQKKYGMRLPTIADRLAERFVRPLDIDRIRALVAPAAEDAKTGRPSDAFEQLEAEAGDLAGQPAGAGLDLPDWLLALEEEVDRVCGPARQPETTNDVLSATPRMKLSWEEILSQLTNWETKFLESKDE